MRTVSRSTTRARRPRAVAVIAALLVAVGGCCLFQQKTASTPPPSGGGSPVVLPPGTLGAGVAAVSIPLGSGIPLAGFGGAPRRTFDLVTTPLSIAAMSGSCVDPDPSTAATLFAPNQGTTDPIMARALVLANGVRTIAFVKLDTIGSSWKLREDLRPVAAGLGIANHDLALLATHTHSGPGTLSDYTAWELAASDCFADVVYQQVRTAAVTALEQAAASVQPARIAIGTTASVADANRNRRGRPAIVDRELALVKITTAGGAPLAALFNFAVHGTAYGASNMQFSKDCMGEMERVVEQGLPGVVALFTNAAEGDVAPAHTGAAGITLEGQTVGGAVVALWSSLAATKSWVELKSALERVQMPPAQYNPAGCMPVPGTSATVCDVIPGYVFTVPLPASWLPEKLPFQAFRIDDTVFVAIPGEPITEIGWDLKARAVTKGFARGVVLGLANDHGSYFTTLAEYQRGLYEGTSTLYGPTTGQVVVDSADAVMTAVQ